METKESMKHRSSVIYNHDTSHWTLRFHRNTDTQPALTRSTSPSGSP
jgi:hypothetical protein